MSLHKHSIIAIDFDGTIATDNYPKIGPPQLFAFDTMQRLQRQGHRLILWTVRTGKQLDEAVLFCKKNGIEFYAINKNYPEEILDNRTARKINADVFIDDRNVGGFIGWGKVHQHFFDEEAIIERPKGFFSFFK
tara:strand:- start:927 stop:1328 length:402 start_codon:yes stop_codon:yes gene_type:complete